MRDIVYVILFVLSLVFVIKVKILLKFNMVCFWFEFVLYSLGRNYIFVFCFNDDRSNVIVLFVN